MKQNFKTKNTEWFEEWFDSPYYHTLYKSRDNKEAEKFIINLINFLKPKQNSLLSDVACGKGRHSIFLNSLGYNVDGFDLSFNSIKNAKKHEAKHLHFYTNDIRNPLKLEFYNYAFNLFTSFGYFDVDSDNQQALNAIAKSLKPNGTLVLDFMNCDLAIKSLKKTESKTIDGITFDIKKDFKDNFITKDINFKVENTNYHFQEKVRAISLSDFEKYFEKANLKIVKLFGDYDLNPFDNVNSDRLILIAKKQ